MDLIQPSAQPTNAQCLVNVLELLLKKNNPIVRAKADELLACLHGAGDLLKSIPTEFYRDWFDRVLNIYKEKTPLTENWSTYLYTFALKYLSLMINIKFTENNEPSYFQQIFINYCEPLFIEILLKLDSDILALNIYVETLIFCLENFIGTDYASVVREGIFPKYSVINLMVKIKSHTSNDNSVLLKNYMTLYLLFDCFTIWHNSDIQFILKSIGSRLSMAKDVHSFGNIHHICLQAIKYASVMNLASNLILEKELIIVQVIPLKIFTEWFTCFREYTLNQKFEDCSIIDSGSILSLCKFYNPYMNTLIISSMLNIIEMIPILKQESLDYLMTVFTIVTKTVLHSYVWLKDDTEGQYLEIIPYVFNCFIQLFEHKLFPMGYELDIPLIDYDDSFFLRDFYNPAILENGLKLINTVLTMEINERIVFCMSFDAFFSLCSMLKKCLHHSKPEIRSCCLVCISSVISHSDFQSETDCIMHILNAQLAVDVLEIFENENDLLVRAQAIECLENMIHVSAIWSNTLKESNLLPLSLMFIQCEAEGIIRQQLVKLLIAVIIYTEMSVELFYQICNIMVHVSIKDPLTEVKMLCFSFWEYVIKILNIGTCSTSELNNNIIKLQNTGCLHVLYVALSFEENVRLKNEAIRITNELLPYIKLGFTETSEFENLSNNAIENEEENLSGSMPKRPRIDILSVDRLNETALLPNNSNNVHNYHLNNTYLIWKPDYEYISLKSFLIFTSSKIFIASQDVEEEEVMSLYPALDSVMNYIINN